ncbi:MAG: AAA family ATPase [Gemmataceae bacterium]|nr:AAA family ATPase [Gemmataceae bacterium]
MSTAPDFGPAAPKRPSGLNARLITHAVRRRPLALIVVVLVAGATAAGVWLFAPLAKNTAAAAFYLSQAQTVLNGQVVNGHELASYKASQAGLIRSRTLVWNRALNETKGLKDLATYKSADPDMLAYLDKNLKIDTRGTGPDVLRVLLEGDEPNDLLVILGAVSKSYLEVVKERENKDRADRYETLKNTVEGYQKEIDGYQKTIDTLTSAAGGQSITEQQLSDQMRSPLVLEATHKLNDARRRVALGKGALAAAQERVDQLKPVPPGDGVGPPGPPPGLPSADPEVAMAFQGSQELAEAERIASTLRERRDVIAKIYNPGAAPLIDIEKKVAAAEEQYLAVKTRLRSGVVRAMTERARAEAQKDLDRAKAAMVGDQLGLEFAEAGMKQLERDFERRKMIRADLLRLQGQIAGKSQARAMAVNELEKVNADLGKVQPRVTKLEDPYLVAGLEGNRRLKFTLGAGVGILLLGFAGLVGWEARSRRVTHTDDATTDLGLRLLGTVPPIGGDGDGGPPPAALAEAIDTARTMLLHGTPAGAAIRTVLVTSGVAGEGKTSLAGHLSISLARAGFRTILVDGDLQSPAAHRLFDCPVGPGLCELLRGEVDLEEAAQTTPIPGLALLPAGYWDTAARQALVGDRWRRLKVDLEARYDFVVVDSAPLLLVSDTLLLAREADGVVLSVLLGVSQVAHVAETAGRLQAVGAKLTGAVVNGVWHKAYRSGAAYRYAAAPVGDGGEEVADYGDQADVNNAERQS